MTDERKSLWRRLDVDWMDISLAAALSSVFAGVWITWSVGIALIVTGSALGALVAVLLFRKPGGSDGPSSNRRP